METTELPPQLQRQPDGTLRELGRIFCSNCQKPMPDAEAGEMCVYVPGSGHFHEDCKPDYVVKAEDEPWADFAAGDRMCFGCGHPCLPEDHPVTSRDGGYFKHFTCWYDDVMPARLGNVEPTRSTDHGE